MKYVSYLKLVNRFGRGLPVLLLALLLAGCGQAAPTPPVVSSKILRPTPTPVLDNSSGVSSIETPTPAPAQPTVTPLGPPSPASVLVAGPTLPTDSGLPDPLEIDPGLSVDSRGGGNFTASNSTDLNIDALPRLDNSKLVPSAIPAQPNVPALKANFGAKGQPKIGVQAGHWLIEAVPDELARLRTQTGGSGGGVREVDVTLDLARRVAKLLQDKGYEVDLLPATVPIGYTADAFVSIHADASTDSGASGFKLARSRFSAIPRTDDALLSSLYASYGGATGMGRSESITSNMTGYYAFNNRHDKYAASKITPAVIIETGYLTNDLDRLYLTGHQAQVAAGIANGITFFIDNRPALDQREKAATTMPGVEILQDNTPVFDKSDGTGAKIAQLEKGQRLESYATRGDYYLVWLPALNHSGFVPRASATPTTVPR